MKIKKPLFNLDHSGVPGDGHASDCATHNAPAEVPGVCDCGEPDPKCSVQFKAGNTSVKFAMRPGDGFRINEDGSFSVITNEEFDAIEQARRGVMVCADAKAIAPFISSGLMYKPVDEEKDPVSGTTMAEAPEGFIPGRLGTHYPEGKEPEGVFTSQELMHQHVLGPLIDTTLRVMGHQNSEEEIEGLDHLEGKEVDVVAGMDPAIDDGSFVMLTVYGPQAKVKRVMQSIPLDLDEEGEPRENLCVFTQDKFRGNNMQDFKTAEQHGRSTGLAIHRAVRKD